MANQNAPTWLAVCVPTFRKNVLLEDNNPHGLRVLDLPKSANPAQRSCRTGPPGYIGWTNGHGSSLCRLASLYGNSVERG
jgi:hypothetical protein